MTTVAVVGAGLAGSEAALVMAAAGLNVTLFEMRPAKMTPAHKTGLPAELVCSNSLKSTAPTTGHGVLKEELALLASPVLDAARVCAVPAGSALAVDRVRFSEEVARRIGASKNIEIRREDCERAPEGFDFVVIAAGPLVSDGLTDWLQREFPHDALSFYDAIAPIISRDSVDTDIVFAASRRNPDDTDYLNCPFSEEEYRAFYEALLEADEVVAHEFEDATFFEACLPVEVMARRGFKVLAFGTLRPIGLVDPRTGRRPYAVCQLRRETRSGEALSLVGFQTRLRIGEQRRVFRMIPGLAQAEFLRYGSIHRNTYLDSPRLLNHDLSFRTHPTMFLAGQLAGGEGYTESIATGHFAARAVTSRVAGQRLEPPTDETAMGALLRHVTQSETRPFAPSNVNFGLMAPVASATGKRVPKRQRKEMAARRAVERMGEWASRLPHPD